MNEDQELKQTQWLKQTWSKSQDLLKMNPTDIMQSVGVQSS